MQHLIFSGGISRNLLWCGWERGSGLDGLEFCGRLAVRGIATIITTDIAKNGKLEGTNYAGGLMVGSGGSSPLARGL